MALEMASSVGPPAVNLPALAPPLPACRLGALDTYASQAVGAGNYTALGSLFRQSVLFLMLHTIPIAGLFGGIAPLLLRMGQPKELVSLVSRYLWTLLPAVWIDAIYRSGQFNITQLTNMAWCW
jgi:Na+-driven multidrug efflux pump